MEAGPDARIGNLIGIGLHVGKSARYSGGRGACHRDLRDVVASEHRLDDPCHRTALDAMGAGLFRVHRRIGNGLPGRITIGGRIAIDVAIANCRNRSPEVVMVLRV